LVKHSRLSVMPVTKTHFDAILALSEAWIQNVAS
jgi:predicted RNA-binding protein with PUA-like domain